MDKGHTMKRTLLSIIAAAGLTLGSTPQISAMDSGLTFAVQIVTAITSHFHGPQAKALQETFVTALTQLQNGCKTKCHDGSLIVAKPYLTNPGQLEAIMKVTYLPASGSAEQKLGEFPLQKPDHFESVENYKYIIGAELARTAKSAARMIDQRIREEKNDRTQQYVESSRKEFTTPSTPNTISNLPTQHNEQELLRRMLDNHILSVDPVLVAVQTDATDGLLFAITTNRIKTKPVWRVLHLPNGLEVGSHRYNGRKKIIEEPVIAPHAGEQDDQYLDRCKKAQADLIARATSIMLQKANTVFK
jgi:hypothetical protein